MDHSNEAPARIPPNPAGMTFDDCFFVQQLWVMLIEELFDTKVLERGEDGNCDIHADAYYPIKVELAAWAMAVGESYGRARPQWFHIESHECLSEMPNGVPFEFDSGEWFVDVDFTDDVTPEERAFYRKEYLRWQYKFTNEWKIIFTDGDGPPAPTPLDQGLIVGWTRFFERVYPQNKDGDLNAKAGFDGFDNFGGLNDLTSELIPEELMQEWGKEVSLRQKQPETVGEISDLGTNSQEKVLQDKDMDVDQDHMQLPHVPEAEHDDMGSSPYILPMDRSHGNDSNDKLEGQNSSPYRLPTCRRLSFISDSNSIPNDMVNEEMQNKVFQNSSPNHRDFDDFSGPLNVVDGAGNGVRERMPGIYSTISRSQVRFSDYVNISDDIISDDAETDESLPQQRNPSEPTSQDYRDFSTFSDPVIVSDNTSDGLSPHEKGYGENLGFENLKGDRTTEKQSQRQVPERKTQEIQNQNDHLICDYSMEDWSEYCTDLPQDDLSIRREQDHSTIPDGEGQPQNLSERYGSSSDWDLFSIYMPDPMEIEEGYNPTQPTVDDYGYEFIPGGHFEEGMHFSYLYDEGSPIEVEDISGLFEGTAS